MPNPILLLMAVMIVYGLYRALLPGGRRYYGNRRVRALWGKYDEIDSVPTHVVCGNLSPDGRLLCRLEIAHGGWHSHDDGSTRWYFNQWAEGDW